ncbi:Chitinase, GH18 family [Clostridium cavendishii DSM 21758]|uniref:Chitinase, GH18 family n=1 Tax=Clostridium cavendishii DSM 21758 TaxID=1121302 RepID=A0A1M6I554_9CLOT|nr:glycosyl hydrolase family 18 protein [Clostridium cavendishii]SHJ29581.1 Chitinase, GH18 family [Clostridium cavendishii DSM 21758]
MKSKKFISVISAVAFSVSLLPCFSTNAFAAQNTSQTKDSLSTQESKKVDRNVIAYFPEWAFKQDSHKNYTVDKMPWSKLTHINYAFANVNQSTNKIDFGDKEAAIEKVFPGQTDAFPYKGHFNVLNSYKKNYPNVKTIISVGGWTDTTGFYKMATTQEGRDTFANSCVDFLKTYNFDGLDIDYEYPTSVSEAGNPKDFKISEPLKKQLYGDYVELMKTLRTKLDEASVKDNKKYTLSAAVTASAWILGGMGKGEYLQYLDFVNLMTYDLHGSWNGYVGHNAALYADSRDPETSQIGYPYLNTDWAVKYYEGAISPDKINIGIPYYTRGWKNVKPSSYPGGLYGEAWINKTPGHELGDGAVGIDNIWADYIDNAEEPGGSNPLWHVKNLLKDKSLGYVRYWDDVSKVPYVWNENKKVWLSFEDEQSMQEKVNYVINKNLGGVMIWEIDGDYSTDSNGDFTVGDTLTSIAKNSFDKAGQLVVNPKTNTLPTAKFNVGIEDKFDHPFNEFKLYIQNDTGKAIPADWKLEFDIPNSVLLKSAWGYDYKTEVRGDLIHFTVTPGWQGALPTGKTVLLDGEMILKTSGTPQNMVLNGYASEYEVGSSVIIDDKKPVTPSITASTTSSTDGNYTVTLNLPDNHKGTEYKIYENNSVVKTDKLTSNNSTKISYAATNKTPGKYSYKAELINNFGTSVSNSIDVSVSNSPLPKPLAPKLSSNTSSSNNGQYTVTLDLPANHKGTEYKIYENNSVIKSDKLLIDTASKISLDLANKDNGTYTYKADLINSAGSTSSNSISVVVNKTPIDSNNKLDFKVTSDWGSGANISFTIKNNSLTPIDNWVLIFTFDKKITQLWDCNFKSLGGNKYQVTPPSWANSLAPGGSYTFGGSCAGNVGNIKPANITINGLPVTY